MIKNKSIPCMLMLGWILTAGCSNPADNVTEAQVSQASESASTPSGGTEVEGTILTIQTANSKIEFKGSKVTGSHDGGFREFSGQIVVKDGAIVPVQSFVEIDMESTWSDSDRLTGHLKNPDFFNVPQFPTSKFVTTKVEPSANGHTVTGDLTLHGVTKGISFPASVKVSGVSATIQAEFFIKRFDFDIVYKGKADDLVRDEVVIRLDIQAAKEG